MKHLELLLQRYPQLICCENDIINSYKLLESTYEQKGKVLACGNGGSASDASHIVGELMKAFVLKRSVDDVKERLFGALAPVDAQYLFDNLQGALPAISLHSEQALTSAYANDVAADMIFAQQVFGYGRAGDSLIAISTSGNSANVLRAVQTAKALNIHTIGLTGQKKGALVPLCDVCISVPEIETFKIQELHLPLYHTLCLMLEEQFFGDRYDD